MPIALQKTFPDGPTSEPEQIRWERSWSTYRVLAVNRDYMLRVLVCRESVLRILPVIVSISGVDTAGTAFTRGPVPLVLPALTVFGPSVLPILPGTRSIWAASTPILSVLGGRHILNTPEYTLSISILGASV